MDHDLISIFMECQNEQHYSICTIPPSFHQTRLHCMGWIPLLWSSHSWLQLGLNQSHWSMGVSWSSPLLLFEMARHLLPQKLGRQVAYWGVCWTCWIDTLHILWHRSIWNHPFRAISSLILVMWELKLPPDVLHWWYHDILPGVLIEVPDLLGWRF